MNSRVQMVWWAGYITSTLSAVSPCLSKSNINICFPNKNLCSWVWIGRSPALPPQTIDPLSPYLNTTNRTRVITQSKLLPTAKSSPTTVFKNIKPHSRPTRTPRHQPSRNFRGLKSRYSTDTSCLNSLTIEQQHTRASLIFHPRKG